MAEDGTPGTSGVLRRTRREMRAGDGGVVPGLGGEEERGVAGARGGVTAAPVLQTGQNV